VIEEANKTHTLTRTGLEVLGISAIIGVLSFGVVVAWSNSFGNFLGMPFGSLSPPNIILCYFGTAGGVVGHRGYLAVLFAPTAGLHGLHG